MTTSLANSFVSVTNAPLMPAAHQSHVVKITSPSNNNLSFSPIRPCIKRRLTVQARADSGGASSSSIFVGGFILGGLVVGALGCVYAPKITEALAGVDKKEVMKKLPKFIYDEEKALEKTRKTLEEKIAQLNLAIDEASGQYQSGDGSY